MATQHFRHYRVVNRMQKSPYQDCLDTIMKQPMLLVGLGLLLLLFLKLICCCMHH